MQSRTGPEDWVPSRGVPWVLWMMYVGEVVLVVIFAGIVFSVPSILDVVGGTAWAGVLGFAFVAGLGTITFLTNTLRPSAVRATPEGIELRRSFGSGLSLAWADTAAGPVRGTFQVLVYRVRPSGMVSSVILTSQQWVALRSSPHRPMAWPTEGLTALPT
jgi:hypothetical protein